MASLPYYFPSLSCFSQCKIATLSQFDSSIGRWYEEKKKQKLCDKTKFEVQRTNSTDGGGRKYFFTCLGVKQQLKGQFHTTHAAKQQAWQIENRQRLFSILDHSARKEIHGYYHFTKSSVGCCSADLAWKFLTFLSVSATDTNQSRAALLWSGWSPRWLSMLSTGHTDSISLLLCCWWTIRHFSCPSAKKWIRPWDDDWTLITGEMGGPNFWFSGWNSHFVHFHVILGGRWHVIEHYINHLNSRHMEFRRAFMHCDY